MIYGIGIDVLEPQRVERLLAKFGQRFARRVLTDLEWPGYLRTRKPVYYVANRFAAKEAFSKAMGTGFRFPVTLGQISVTPDPAGKPVISYGPALEPFVRDAGVVNCCLTISDEKNLACAVVVLER